MKILYTYKEGTEPIYVNGSNGVQRVLIVFKDDNRTYVYYCDDYLRQMFLNEIISTSLMGFDLANFRRIDNDEQFNRYLQYITDNYNYSGQHIGEKIDGHGIYCIAMRDKHLVPIGGELTKSGKILPHLR